MCELHADLARCAGKVSHEDPGSQIIINLHWDKTRMPLLNLVLDNHHFVAVVSLNPSKLCFVRSAVQEIANFLSTPAGFSRFSYLADTWKG